MPSLQCPQQTICFGKAGLLYETSFQQSANVISADTPQGEVTYTVVIVCVKFSILFLYWRTFAPLNIKWEIVVMCVLTFLWGVAVVRPHL